MRCTASGDPSQSTSLQRSAGSSLIVVRPNPHSAACTGSTGSPDSVATARSVTIHSPPGSFTASTALHGVHGAEQVGDLGLEPRAEPRRSTLWPLGPALRQTTPENGSPRSCSLCQHLSQELRIGGRGRTGCSPAPLAASSSNPAISQVPFALPRRLHPVAAAAPRASQGCTAAGWHRRRGRATTPRGARV